MNTYTFLENHYLNEMDLSSSIILSLKKKIMNGDAKYVKRILSTIEKTLKNSKVNIHKMKNVAKDSMGEIDEILEDSSMLFTQKSVRINEIILHNIIKAKLSDTRNQLMVKLYVQLFIFSIAIGGVVAMYNDPNIRIVHNKNIGLIFAASLAGIIKSRNQLTQN